MTGVCPIPLLSPAQFTEAACQFRYAPYTQNAYIYCMYACLHVDFFKYVRVWMLHHNPSHRSLSFPAFHIFTLGAYRAVCTPPNRGEKKLWQTCCVTSLAFWNWELCVLCAGHWCTVIPGPPQPATHINTSASSFHSGALKPFCSVSQT